MWECVLPPAKVAVVFRELLALSCRVRLSCLSVSFCFLVSSPCLSCFVSMSCRSVSFLFLVSRFRLSVLSLSLVSLFPFFVLSCPSLSSLCFVSLFCLVFLSLFFVSFLSRSRLLATFLPCFSFSCLGIALAPPLFLSVFRDHIAFFNCTSGLSSFQARLERRFRFCLRYLARVAIFIAFLSRL